MGAIIVPVDGMHDARLDAFARLTDVELRSKLEPERALFIAESEKVIRRALDAGFEMLAVLSDAKKASSLQPLLQCVEDAPEEIPVYLLPKDEIAGLTGYELTRGVLAAFRRPALPSVRELINGAHRVAVLEDITNHTNVGAIFRSAAALGVDAVLVTPGCYDPLYRRAVRVSMGTVFQVAWTYIGQDVSGKGAHGNVRRAGGWTRTGIPALHEAGFRVAAMALSSDAVSIDDERLMREDKLAIVLGTEGEGLSRATIEAADYTVCIPMHHGVDSLNVAAASAVAFWQLRYR